VTSAVVSASGNQDQGCGMATERLTMRRTREILRLRWSLGRSTREAAAAVGVSTGVIGKCTARATTAGLDWATIETLNDELLERRLYGEPTPSGSTRPEPSPAHMHQELKKAGVTLELLHLEYLEQHPSGLQYTAFCERYRAWRKVRFRRVRVADQVERWQLGADFSDAADGVRLPERPGRRSFG